MTFPGEQFTTVGQTVESKGLMKAKSPLIRASKVQ